MRMLLRSLVLLLLALAAPAAADPADIDAAARGVVRVVLIAERAGEVTPVSHGTGFAVSPTHIVTNAHVIQEALQDDTLRIGVVPSEGERGTFARIIAISPRNDLALIEITKGTLRLPPLTLAGGVSADAGEEVSACLDWLFRSWRGQRHSILRCCAASGAEACSAHVASLLVHACASAAAR